MTKAKHHGNVGFKCRRCGAERKYLWQLSQHAAKEHGSKRKGVAQGMQITPIFSSPDFKTAIRRLEHKGGSIRTYLTGIIPSDWTWISMMYQKQPDGRMLVLIRHLKEME